MGLALILFWVIVIWGLIDREIYAKEGAIYIAIWLALFAGMFFYEPAQIVCIVATILLDIFLIFKVFGGNIGLRP